MSYEGQYWKAATRPERIEYIINVSNTNAIHLNPRMLARIQLNLVKYTRSDAVSAENRVVGLLCAVAS